MNKYIDSEKLIAEIERLLKCTELHRGDAVVDGSRQTLYWIKDFITSLRQEQPKVDLVAELKSHLATTPKEQLEKEWEELEPWGNIGPTVQEFLYGKQPEVDYNKFEKLFGDFCERNKGHHITSHDACMWFWKLGLNARKEK